MTTSTGADARTDDWERWWATTAPTLEREHLARALSGRRGGADAVVRDRLLASGLAPRSTAERRQLARALIGGPAGAHLPAVTRIGLARACAQVGWSDVCRCVREAERCSDREVDRLLAEAGASVSDRLGVWGLARS